MNICVATTKLGMIFRRHLHSSLLILRPTNLQNKKISPLLFFIFASSRSNVWTLDGLQVMKALVSQRWTVERPRGGFSPVSLPFTYTDRHHTLTPHLHLQWTFAFPQKWMPVRIGLKKITIAFAFFFTLQTLTESFKKKPGGISHKTVHTTGKGAKSVQQY